MEKKIQRTSIINDKKAVSFDIMRLNNEKMNQIHGHTIDKNGKIFKIFLKRRKIGNHKNHINTDTSYKLNPKEVYGIFDESKKETNNKNIKIKITKKKTQKSPTKISKKDDTKKAPKKTVKKDSKKVVKKDTLKKDPKKNAVKKDAVKKDAVKKDAVKKDPKKVVKKDKVKKSKKSLLKTVKK